MLEYFDFPRFLWSCQQASVHLFAAHHRHRHLFLDSPLFLKEEVPSKPRATPKFENKCFHVSDAHPASSLCQPFDKTLHLLNSV